MSYAILDSAPRGTITVVARRPPLVAAMAEALGQAWAAMCARRVVAGLSDAQLKDVGIDRAELFGNRPTIEVPARLMSSLDADALNDPALLVPSLRQRLWRRLRGVEATVVLAVP